MLKLTLHCVFNVLIYNFKKDQHKVLSLFSETIVHSYLGIQTKTCQKSCHRISSHFSMPFLLCQNIFYFRHRYISVFRMQILCFAPLFVRSKKLYRSTNLNCQSRNKLNLRIELNENSSNLYLHVKCILVLKIVTSTKFVIISHILDILFESL